MQRQGFGTTKTMPMGPTHFLLMGAIFAFAGLVMVAVATALTLTSRDFYATASQTDGVVTDFDRSWSRDSDGRYDETYCPIVEFTVDGNPYRFEDNVCSSSEPTVGGAVTVAYQPDDPERARILGGWFHRYLGPLITGPMGVLFGGIGLLLIIFRNRAQPPTPQQPLG